MLRLSRSSVVVPCSLLLFTVGIEAHADSMSALITQKSIQPDTYARYAPSYPAIPPVKISTRSTIQLADSMTFHYSSYKPLRYNSASIIALL